MDFWVKMVLGKTSLIREIVNRNNKDIIINPSVKIAYFKQELDNLNPEKTVIENVMEDSIQTQTTIRNALGNLNIKGDQVYNLARYLSGGEKVKVSLAKAILSNANFLILDEPTNFLDIQSIEGLERMLKEYRGTVLLVSHDKTFIDNVVDNILIIENKKVIQYDGNYTKYLEEKQNKTDINKTIYSNNKLLLSFQITKLESKIAITNDNAKKEKLIEELDKIKTHYQNI